MSWPAGTIVVCVNDREIAPDAVIVGRPLFRGEYYTVRGWAKCDDGCGVLLSENRIVYPFKIHPAAPDAPWNPLRFRLAESSHSEAGSVRAQEPAHV